jgi:hypothetical protein
MMQVFLDDNDAAVRATAKRNAHGVEFARLRRPPHPARDFGQFLVGKYHDILLR